MSVRSDVDADKGCEGDTLSASELCLEKRDVPMRTFWPALLSDEMVVPVTATMSSLRSAFSTCTTTRKGEMNAPDGHDSGTDEEERAAAELVDAVDARDGHDDVLREVEHTMLGQISREGRTTTFCEREAGSDERSDVH